ncbi:MAG: hypothetical protein LBT44_08105 [Clostridiales bacterium]|nr:hypothetical protein [Clostridiales bacterium]
MLYWFSNDAYKEGVDKNILQIGDYYSFNINFIYWLLLLEIIISAAVVAQKKRIPLDSLILILIMAGQIGVNILKGPAEFHRLNAVIYPFTIVVLARYANTAILWYNTVHGGKNICKPFI